MMIKYKMKRKMNFMKYMMMKLFRLKKDHYKEIDY